MNINLDRKSYIHLLTTLEAKIHTNTSMALKCNCITVLLLHLHDQISDLVMCILCRGEGIRTVLQTEPSTGDICSHALHGYLYVSSEKLTSNCMTRDGFENQIRDMPMELK